MIETLQTSPLTTLAQRANEAHRKGQEAATAALEHYYEAGKFLTEAKEHVPHGGWLMWLEANFEGGRSSAANYMRLFRHWGELKPNVQTSAHLGLHSALELLKDTNDKEPEPPKPVPPARKALEEFEEDLQPAIYRTAHAEAKALGQEITPSLVSRVGRVIQEAAVTGHVDLGDGESTPFSAALRAEHSEAYKRQGEYIHEAKEKRVHVSNNSGNNEWYTPPEYIKAIQKVMGSIDLDPASSSKANEVVGASAYFDKEMNGLQRDWKAPRVWMNPPYASDLIGKFIDKLLHHITEGDIAQAAVLVNNATDTAWFQSIAPHATAICFPKGRIRFVGANGEQGAPLQGQAILYIGADADTFRQEFSQFGFVR